MFAGDHDGEDLNVDVDAALAGVATTDGEHHEEHHDEHDEFYSAFSTVDQTNFQGEKPKPWATLLVNFASLSGLFHVSDTQGANAKKGRLFDLCVPAFAVGALTSTQDVERKPTRRPRNNRYQPNNYSTTGALSAISPKNSNPRSHEQPSPPGS